MVQRLLWLHLLLFVLGPGLKARPQKGRPTAESMTVQDRGLGRALQGFLREGPRKNLQGTNGEAPERMVMLLLDPTPSLQGVGLLSKLEATLGSLKQGLQHCSIGLRRIGDPRTKILPPTRDFKVLLQALAEAVIKIDPGFHNCYPELRSLANYLGKRQGQKEILLINLDNPDVEGALEKTVRVLQKNGVRLSVLTREAYISDPYWEARSYQRPPRGTRLYPADGPFIDLPWGWVFQLSSPGEVSPAGFAVYGMNRLAAATGGKVYLFSPKALSKHNCAYLGTCIFCSGDHLQQSEEFWEGRINLFAPSVESRKEAFRAVISDPVYRAVDRAWREAARAGLIRSLPAIKLGATSASPQRKRPKGWASLLASLNLKSNAKKADRLRGACAKILATLDAALARPQKNKASPRSLATAALTRYELQLALVNLVTYAAWCRETAPRLLAERERPPAPPEIPWILSDQRPQGIGFSNLSLCHGADAFQRVHLPGGALLKKELSKLQSILGQLEETYAHSGYAFGMHRAGIATFYFTFPGKGRVAKRPRHKSHKKDSQTPSLPRGRPSRTGAGSVGRGGGARTGGGK